jgi:hypothetical protein
LIEAALASWLKGRKARRRPREAEVTLEEQLLTECRAMIRYAFATGKVIPSGMIEGVERLHLDHVNPQVLQELVMIHSALARLIAPATPRSITTIHEQQGANQFLRFLGPVRLIRALTVVASLLSIILVVLSLLDASPIRVMSDADEASGWDLAWRVLYLLSAAGLGATFAVLFVAYRSVFDGTYDLTEESSYWSSIVLGLVVGVVLAELVPVDVLRLEKKWTDLLVAFLGGISAPAVHRVFKGLIDVIETAIQGSAEDETAKAAEESAQLTGSEDPAVLGMRALRLLEEAERAGLPQPFRSELESLLEELVPAQATSRIDLPESIRSEDLISLLDELVPPEAPGPVASAFALGSLLAKQGNVEAARAPYVWIMNSGDTRSSAAAAFGLGLLLSKQGDMEGAKAAYKQALDSGDQRAVRLARLAHVEQLPRQLAVGDDVDDLELRVLDVLDEAISRDEIQIASAATLSPPQAAETVERLMRKGYVKKTSARPERARYVRLSKSERVGQAGHVEGRSWSPSSAG